MDRYVKILKVSWQSSFVLTIAIALLSLMLAFILKDSDSISQHTLIFCTSVCMLIIAFLLIFSDRWSRNRMKKLQKEELLTKLVKYKSIYVKQMICFVLMSLVCLITILITKKIEVLLFDVFAILMIIAKRPNGLKVKMDLNLSKEELSKFNHIKFGHK